VLEAMLKSRWLVADGRDYTATRGGERALATLGVSLADTRKPRRAFARACVDLTQRRPHLGGSLGDALLDAYLARGWILRSRRSRAVTITPKGRDGFRDWLGVH